jgi:hypothetical protein
MNPQLLKVLDISTYLPFCAFLLWGVYRKFLSSKPVPGVIAFPIRILRILLIIITFGVLGGCTNPDPLAVATGPIFALNAGHWQPSPQDLAAVPVVAKQ